MNFHGKILHFVINRRPEGSFTIKLFHLWPRMCIIGYCVIRGNYTEFPSINLSRNIICGYLVFSFTFLLRLNASKAAVSDLFTWLHAISLLPWKRKGYICACAEFWAFCVKECRQIQLIIDKLFLNLREHFCSPKFLL